PLAAGTVPCYGTGGTSVRGQRYTVEGVVEPGVLLDDLHVFAGFSEGDPLTEEFRILPFGELHPAIDAVGAGIVCGKHGIDSAVVLGDHVGEELHAEADVDEWFAEHGRLEAGNTEPACESLAGRRHDLHQSDGSGWTDCPGVEQRLLSDETGGQERIDAVARGFGSDRIAVRQRVGDTQQSRVPP